MTNKHLDRWLSQSLEVDISTLATNKHTSPRRTRVVQALNARLGSVSVFFVVCKILLCLFLEDLVELVVGFFESSTHLLLESFEGAHSLSSSCCWVGPLRKNVMEEQSFSRVLEKLRGNGELLLDRQEGCCHPRE